MLKRIRALLGRRSKKSAAGAQVAGQAAPPAPSRSRDDGLPPQIHQGPKIVHWPIPAVDLDPDAVKIVKRLTRFDHRAYLVGGCVRDLLLDRKPKDFDVGTSATPRQIKRVFRNSRIIGRRFRLAHIYFQNGKIIEVATFRAHDPPDADGADAEPDEQDLLIRDDNVFGTPEQDALRRDFTVNALFYDVEQETVLDYADGLGDLRRKLVRTIGDPHIRFREDPIRILRAIKFAARLGFAIEANTLEALRSSRGELDKAAMARVLEEVNRFCRGGAAHASFELLGQTGVFEVVFPDLARGYSRDQRAWTFMLDLLQQMDRLRAEDPREIRTGEIFAAMLLPLLAPRFGWSADGEVAEVRGLNVPHLIDETLRSTALRLRIPRREQEHCRQILGTLTRMVPARRVRRGSKRVILRRECLPEALWLLNVLAQRLGREFEVARAFWTADAGPRQRTVPLQPEAAAPPRTPAARRGRRRGRRRGTGEKPALSEALAPAGAGGAPKPGMPPPWDDNYFFAALPSAPEIAGDEEAQGDRYGAAALGPAGTTADGAPASVVIGANATATAKPKRRRRRRRKPTEAASGAIAGGNEAAEETDSGDTLTVD